MLIPVPSLHLVSHGKQINALIWQQSGLLALTQPPVYMHREQMNAILIQFCFALSLRITGWLETQECWQWVLFWLMHNNKCKSSKRNSFCDVLPTQHASLTNPHKQLAEYGSFCTVGTSVHFMFLSLLNPRFSRSCWATSGASDLGRFFFAISSHWNWHLDQSSVCPCLTPEARGSFPRDLDTD